MLAACLLLLLPSVLARTTESLTSVVARGEDVFEAARVGPLPGITAVSYAGWFTVNATAHANHFCWYWPALNGNTSAPLLVWMQGGPGASSLFGLFVETGPYRLDATLTPHANPSTCVARAVLRRAARGRLDSLIKTPTSPSPPPRQVGE
jgi:carboxypeptidase C (cathepsin A)